MRLPLSRVAEFTRASGSFDHSACAVGYSIDSRTVAAGELFFAIQGERLDGHDFVAAALQKGAVAAVIAASQLSRFADHSKLIVVDETTLALQNLGAAARRLWGRRLIAVTGSAGKTTTKECIAHVMGEQFQFLLRLEPSVEHERRHTIHPGTEQYSVSGLGPAGV